MEYYVQYVKDMADFLQKKENFSKVEVNKYPWNCGYQPKTYAQLGWNEEGIFVYMRAYEPNPRMVEEKDNGDIYMDSCLEFFINPCPDQVVFCNFEVNPRGYMYLAFGPEALAERTLQDRSVFGGFDLALRDPKELKGKEYWDVCYRVPTAYFKKFNPEFVLADGVEFQANFYKCGDGTAVPHYGCWSPITSGEAEPNFYHVCDFGKIVLKNGE